MPGKSEIELMPHDVHPLANARRAQSETGGLVAREISEKHVGISAHAAVHLKTTIN